MAISARIISNFQLRRETIFGLITSRIFQLSVLISFPRRIWHLLTPFTRKKMAHKMDFCIVYKKWNSLKLGNCFRWNKKCAIWNIFLIIYVLFTITCLHIIFSNTYKLSLANYENSIKFDLEKRNFFWNPILVYLHTFIHWKWYNYANW